MPFITTFTGRKVNPLDLKPEDIDLKDIAHHLACANRFVGALREPVSVAQHAVYVSRLLDDTPFVLHGLHHDDSEAYLGDVSKWVKQDPCMAGYRDAETRAQKACDEAFGIVWTPEAHEAVEWADRVMVRYEGMRGLHNKGKHMFEENVGGKYPPLTPEEIARIGKWKPWHWREAEEAFLTRARCIRNKIY